MMAQTSVIVVVFAIMSIASTPHRATAECTLAEKREMKELGYSYSQIKEECGESSARVPSQRPGRDDYRYQPASVCATSWGVCPMMNAVPIGAPCTCYMPTGNFPGVAR